MEEGEECKEEEEIRTTMQSSVAMEQSCTRGPRLSCLTFFSEQA